MDMVFLSVEQIEERCKNGFMDDSQDIFSLINGLQSVQTVIINQKLMSCLIEDKDNYFLQLQLLTKPGHLPNLAHICGNQLVSTLKLDSFPKFLQNHDSTLIASTSSPSFSSFHYHSQNIYKNISAMSTVSLNIKTLTFKLQIKLLNKENQYLRLKDSQRKKIIMKLLTKKTIQKDFKIKIGPTNGDICFSFPFFHYSADFQMPKIANIIQKILKNFTYNLKFHFQFLDAILETTETTHREITRSGDKQLFANFMKNYQYRNIMNLQLCLPSEGNQDQKSLNDRILNEKESSYRIRDGFQSFQAEFRLLQLYNHFSVNYHTPQAIKSSLFLSQEQKQTIKTKIQLPSISKYKLSEQQTVNINTKLKISQQNPYILNHIMVNKIDPNNKCRKINSGGFTDIYLTQIIYWYIGSYGMGTPSDIASIIAQPPLKKILVIKREKQDLKLKGEKSRVAHQKQILKKIKNGLNYFLCKYYLPDKYPEMDSDLISDYIDFPNFYEYCLRNRQLMSLHTKIYFSLMIAQSLRYLKEYKIVHLDLKPSNIMISKRLMIKLIDFGQSFHPDLDHHFPGFTMPYSAPQNYIEDRHFTHKNDVFSLGVIMYELFFRKDPFYFYGQSLKRQVYTKGNYSNYFYFCPQECKLAGQSRVFPLIQSILMKCLNPDPSFRPQLQWIVYILRQCLNYFY